MPDHGDEKETARLYGELFPGPDDHLKGAPSTAPPMDEEGRRMHELYNELFPPRKEAQTNMTPEEQARVNTALSRVELSNQIGGASDAGGKPVPNEPTPLEKARDIGQDMHKAGVTMEPDK